MLALGVILVLIAAAAVLAALIGGSDQTATFDLGAVNVETNTFSAFLIGAVTVVVLVLGIWLMQAGARGARKRRQERKELDRLSKKVEAQESGGASTTAHEKASAGDTRTDTQETRTDTDVRDSDRPSS